jgi:hypothetical protein
MDGFGGFWTLERVEVDLLTDAFRIAGSVETRFGRVTDILNQLTATHLAVRQATISEHGDPGGPLAAPSALVDVASILLLSAPGLTGGSSADMRIEKRPVKAMLAMPPIRATGTIHVPIGSRPVDGLLNVTDRYLAMTDVTITSGRYPELRRTLAAVAIRRDRAQVLLVADDERPDELLAEILDERTAEAWLRPEESAE